MARVLIIEDDPYVQRLYKRAFAFANHDIQVADDGITGLKHAKENPPSLILLDIMMPGMNGLDVLEKLKKDSATAHIPVLILTNFGQEENRKRAMSLGAKDVLIKSDTPPERLIAEVDALTIG